MAVRAIIGFDHLPQNDVNWINYASHDITRGADLSAQNTIVNGWLVSNATASGAERVTIPLDKYLVAPVGKIWIGIRCRSTLNARGGAGIIYFNGTYVMLDTVIPVTGQISYLEFAYDVASGTIERWVNGVKQANGGSPGSGLRALTLGLESKGSLNGRYDWRDIYVCDDQGAAQGLPIGPLGPQVAYPITLDSAVSADWVTTPGGTPLLEALSEAGTIPTAKIATSVSNAPITASLKATLPAGTVVNAIELMGGGRSSVATPTRVAAKISSGGTDVVGLTPTAPITNYIYSLGFGVFHKAPNGTIWNNASIDATDLILTPDV